MGKARGRAYASAVERTVREVVEVRGVRRDVLSPSLKRVLGLLGSDDPLEVLLPRGTKRLFAARVPVAMWSL